MLTLDGGVDAAVAVVKGLAGDDEEDATAVVDWLKVDGGGDAAVRSTD